MEDCLDQMDTKTKVWCISISLSVIVSTILVGVSFAAVEPLEYGIMYNTISKKIDTDNIYEGGLNWVGLFNKMITFPRTYVSIEYSDNNSAN